MEHMGYSWYIITTRDLIKLRNTIYNDFFSYLELNSKDCKKIFDSSIKSEILFSSPPNEYLIGYEFTINNEIFYLEVDDKYYYDLCYKIAIELYQYNLGISYSELFNKYELESKNIMHYLYLVFIGEIKINEEEK